MKKKRIGLISGNLVARPCPDGGNTCLSECEQTGTNCGPNDAGRADGAVTNDGGTDGGP